MCAPSICAVYFQKTYGKSFSKRTRMSVVPCIRAGALPHYRLFFLLHFYNNTAILKAMKRRATGLTMQLISLKSSFPIQDGKHSRQIEQMPQNNEIAASVNKLSVSLLKRCGVDARSLVEIKRRRIGYTLSIYFDVATTQIPAYFQKVLDTPITGNTITRHSTLDTRHSTLDTRHSTLDTRHSTLV